MLGTLYGLYKCIWVGNDFVFHQNVIFWQFCERNFTVAGVFRIDIWFSLLIPKIKLDPPTQGKNALVFIF